MNVIERVYRNSNLQDVLATLIIFIATFPVLEPDYAIGLDSSYIWALNHLFVYDYDILKQIIYPFGPLGFLKSAVVEGYNFEFSLSFFSFVKIWFTYLFVTVVGKIKNRKILSYFAITIMLLFFNIDLLIIGLSFLSSFLFLNNCKYHYIVIAIFVAFLGIAIKSSIGVSSLSIVFVTFILDFFNTRKYLLSLQFASIALVVVVLSGLVIFNSFGLLLYYFFNTLRLSVSYSSALSIFPENNWVLLSIVILTVILPLFLSSKKENKAAFFMLAPSLFAMWKHSMTRQDFTHSSIMLSFLFLYWGLFLVVSSVSVKKILLLATISISLFYSNMQNTWNFKPKQVEVSGIVNFERTVLNFNGFKSKYSNLSAENVQNNRLNAEVISIIGNETVDSYPWELSYFSANKELNWKMRRTLQSGSFSRWLDKYNAEDFSQENGPQFLIFHYVPDEWGGKFGSIDNRYLLNDNPLTIFEIFKNYTLRLKTNGFLLLEKNDHNNLKVANKTDVSLTRWGNWIDLSNMDNDLLIRVLISSEQNLFGKIKSFLYKTEQYYIDYQTEEGKIFTFRFIPENAKDGIWVNPFIRNPQNTFIEEKVAKIRVRCTHPLFNKEEIYYQIETIQYLENSTQTNFNAYFDKNRTYGDLVFDFDTNLTTNENGNEVKSNGGFSFTYSISLDSIWDNLDTNVNQLLLETDLNYLNDASEGVHIVSLSESENNFWKARKLNTGEDFWNNSLHIIELERHKHNKGIVKIYVWNTGKSPVYIDRFRVKCKAISR